MMNGMRSDLKVRSAERQRLLYISTCILLLIFACHDYVDATARVSRHCAAASRQAFIHFVIVACPDHEHDIARCGSHADDIWRSVRPRVAWSPAALVVRLRVARLVQDASYMNKKKHFSRKFYSCRDWDWCTVSALLC